MKNIFIYLFLGIIQGITEPLPISSSGHLLIFKNLLNINVEDLNFEIIVNLASLVAVLFLYRKKLLILIKDFFKYLVKKDIRSKQNYNYVIYIIIGTIPAGIIGLIFKDKIENLSNNIKIIGVALLITSLFLFIVRNINGKKENISFIDSIKIGMFQAVAILPGISRSGSTIVGGLLSNIKKNKAVDYSFMLYIPISIATSILGIKDLIDTPNINNLLLPYIFGFVASLITTYLSLKFFINLVKKNKLIYFVYYCLIVGTLIILFL